VGGMGEVYRATDTTLKRQVAIKVLPEAVAGDAERLARFQREAEVLAALNHPHIAAIYGLERSTGTTALVMELVEGPTLADRIAQGAIPLDEALALARQVAEALEAAHEQGIVHRDLKPANVKVRDDGTVKVLDFGLAKAIEPHNALSPSVSQLPTVTSPALVSHAGVILGTAAYMSPEQARGKPVDKRSDVWAFGTVLYEMVTGRRAFPGDDVSDVLASVLAREPDWTLLPRALSPLLETYIKRCLHKDRRQRIGDVQSIRLALQGAFDGTETQTAATTVVSPSSRWRRYLLPAVAAFSTATAAVTAVAAWILWPVPERPLVNRFNAYLPDGRQFRGGGRPIMALSPDGRQFVYNTNGGLYLRTMGELGGRLIPGTENLLTSPTFSPDGQSVAYYQDNQLKRIGLFGGAPVVIGAATNPFGVSWEADNTILFGQPDGIRRVSANGGIPELVIRAETGEQVHGPQMLPDGESVLFSVTRATGNARWDQADIVVQSLRTGQRTVVLKGGSDARYVPTGHLVYALGDGLFAIAFDVNRREAQGGPVSVVEGVRRSAVAGVNTGTANYEISNQGTLVYATGEPIPRTLVWVDRTGMEQAIPAPARQYVAPRLSPDGTRVALNIADQEQDIWIWDLARQALTRLTFDPATDNYPLWSPDSQRLIFASGRSGSFNLYWQAADGTGMVGRLTESRTQQYPVAVTPDGTGILFQERVSGGPHDLMRLPLSPQRQPSPEVFGTPTPLIQTMFNEQNAELAPKGQWLAYESNESGRFEIYVRPFPNVEAGRWQVSTNGGTAPVWARSGAELFFSGADGTIQGVRVDRSPTWRSSTPTTVVQGSYYLPGPGTVPARTFDVSPDGKRFLMIKDSGSEAPSPPALIIVEHWFEELKRLVPRE
jgi:serine/threonine protein kinase/Tol biopolymer transport system component